MAAVAEDRPPAGSVPPGFFEALASYNRGRYVECGSGLEDACLRTHPEDQPFLRALVALACAMHLHFERGGGRGTTNLLRQSLVGLEGFRPRHFGVDVDELASSIEAYFQELQGRKKPGARFFDRWLAPRVRYRPPESAR